MDPTDCGHDAYDQYSMDTCLVRNITNGSVTYFADEEQLYDIPWPMVVILSTFYVLIVLIAVIANALVLWVILTSRRMHTVTNYLICSLAFADIIIGMFSIPLQFQAALLQYWSLPYFMCPLCPFVRILSVNVSIFSLTAIAIHRYHGVIKPLRVRTSKTNIIIIIALIWILGAVLAFPISLALRIRMFRDVSKTGAIDFRPICVNVNFTSHGMLYYRFVLFLLQYLIPLCINGWAYSRMIYKLRNSDAPGNAEEQRDAIIHRNKRKVIKMFVIVVALFALCWLPLQTYNLMQELFPQINGYRYINIIWFCMDWLAMSNSCCNPFVYGIYNETFKKELLRRFPALGGRFLNAGPSEGDIALVAGKSVTPSPRNKAEVSERARLHKRTLSVPKERRTPIQETALGVERDDDDLE